MGKLRQETMTKIAKIMAKISKMVTRAAGIIRSEGKEFIERRGIYIFFISLILFTQIDWIRKHFLQHSGYHFEIRLLVGFFSGLLISVGIIDLTKELAGKIGKEPETLVKELSICLSPGIFFFFASHGKIFLFIGGGLCLFAGLYIWVKGFRDFVASIVYVEKFKSKLIMKNNDAAIEIGGVYEKSNPKAMQCFITDLLINLYECSEMKIGQVKVDLSNLEGRDGNELNAIVESVARYFNIRIIY